MRYERLLKCAHEWRNVISLFTLLAVAFYTLLTFCLLITSRDTEKRETRAYVSLEISGFKYTPPLKKEPDRFGISLVMKNGGKTWARNLIARMKSLHLARFANVWNEVDWDVAEPIVLGPDQSLSLQFEAIMFADLDSISDRSDGREYLAWITYDDVFNAKPSPQTQMVATVYSGERDISFNYEGTHNCADSDCPPLPRKNRYR